MDKINPTHYKGTIECIDAIESTMTKEAYRGYLKGNVLKYVWRYEKKNGVEDLEKAQWYLKRLIESL
jgi:CRISPR/Cas system-associated protein Cas5 (RAMP superfamily)